MKRFFRTAVGKAVVFLICVVSLAVLAVCAAGIVFSLENADILYLDTAEQFRDELFLREFRNIGYDLAWRTAEREPSGKDGVLILSDQDDSVFIIRNEKMNVVARSESSEDYKFAEPYAAVPADSHKVQFDITYYVYETEYGREVSYLTGSEMPDNGSGREPDETLTVSFILKGHFPKANRFMAIARYSHYVYRLRYAVYVLAFLSLLSAAVSFVSLMYLSGRRPDTDELIPGSFSRIPFELIIAAAAALTAVMVLLCMYVEKNTGLLILLTCMTAFVTLCLLIGLCMCFAARVKQRTFLKTSLLSKVFMSFSWLMGMLWGLVKRIFLYFADGIRNIPAQRKTVLIYAGFCLFEIIVHASLDMDEEGMMFLIIERLILLPGVVIIAGNLGKLQKSGQALAEGDLAHYTDTAGMFGDLKRHGEDLNSIAKGMAIAVEDRLRSERMKTELITNVSHDLKTPLTSIINYASLIGEEKCDNEKITEYSEVLVRQSERLKRLIEDLVEASKASTGNLEVDLVPCDASVFLDQASGEYAEKLAAADLTLITGATDKKLTIMADGRRMWRIFDNLMNNICKYAMPGTRVYLSLGEEDGNAVFTFKNTSRDELNISEEELMERFTRGDSSRNTEGNGLGLSIARSMAELQGGMLDLSIDGDLFKAILSFPVTG